MSRYGWKPQLPDFRDGPKVVYPSLLGATQRSALDLSGKMPLVYDQGQLGSCTCNAFAALVDFVRGVQGLAFITPSRLWLYYMVRQLENGLGSDSGAELRDVMKVLTSTGVPHESEWPYDEAKYNDPPPSILETEAGLYKTIKYRSPTVDEANLKAGLALGFPFAFGFTVYDSFESNEVTNTGILPMPGMQESVQGGHAVVGCGFDDSVTHSTWKRPGAFKVRNSWGPDWGLKGYFYMSYDYMVNPDLTSDFWSIRLEEATPKVARA